MLFREHVREGCILSAALIVGSITLYYNPLLLFLPIILPIANERQWSRLQQIFRRKT